MNSHSKNNNESVGEVLDSSYNSISGLLNSLAPEDGNLDEENTDKYRKNQKNSCKNLVYMTLIKIIVKPFLYKIM